MAELIKTMRITPNATSKIAPFDAHFGRKANPPLSYLSTSPKLSYLSWENTKLSCLDEKFLSKPALTPETMWNRDANSAGELDLAYKDQTVKPTDHHYVPKPIFNPVPAVDNMATLTQQSTSDTIKS